MHRADVGDVYVVQNYNTPSVSNNISGWGLSGRRKAVGNSDDTILIPEGLGTECLIPTKGNKTMNIKLHANAWSAHAMDTYIAIEVYNAQKRLIYSYYADAASQEVNGRPGESWEEDDGWHGTPDVFDIDTTLTVDVSKTEGVWIIYTIGTKYAGSDGKWAACHYAFHIYSVSFAGNTVTYPVCGYRDGQVLSSKPAYGGSNYEACIVTARNALLDYPYASPQRREDFSIMILRAKFKLAQQSVEAKRLDRYRDTIDEYYGFVNEYPESKYLKDAQRIFAQSERYVNRKS